MKRLVTFAAVSLCLSACNPQPQRPPTATPGANPTPTGVPPLNITGRGSRGNPVRIVQQSGNRKLYALVAKSYESHSAQSISQATFAQTEVTFYDKDGTTLSARSPVAQVDERAKQVILSGGVQAKTSSGLTLVCDRLTYDRAAGAIHGQGHVRITGSQGGTREVLTGNSFTSDVNLTHMVIK